jgi:hypothetical protein
MGDYDKYLAKKTLELLEDTIIGCQPGKSGPGAHEGFENEDVILMIKLWEKAVILRLGFSDRDWAVYTSNHEPPKLAKGQKRSEAAESHRCFHSQSGQHRLVSPGAAGHVQFRAGIPEGSQGCEY